MYPMNLLDFPVEILREILNPLHLDPLDFTMCKHVCKTIAQLSHVHSSHRYTVCEVAVLTGQLKILKEVVTLGYTLDRFAYKYAMIRGNMEILTWLRWAVKCPWDKNTFADAIDTGNIKMVKWAYHQGCPGLDFALQCVYMKRDIPYYEMYGWLSRQHKRRCDYLQTDSLPSSGTCVVLYKK